MKRICYVRHRFPAPFIQQAVLLYLRFTLSYRDIEDLLAEPGIDVSHETVRRWGLKFGSAIAGRSRRLRSRPTMLSKGNWRGSAETVKLRLPDKAEAKVLSFGVHICDAYPKLNVNDHRLNICV